VIFVDTSFWIAARMPRDDHHFEATELERGYSFVDATSFALMRSLRIKQALAFDGDFEAAGFVELRP
jgi:predicted nucleic acid-binding protein